MEEEEEGNYQISTEQCPEAPIVIVPKLIYSLSKKSSARAPPVVLESGHTHTHTYTHTHTFYTSVVSTQAHVDSATSRADYAPLGTLFCFFAHPQQKTPT